eukprot:9874294-Alexandrium_andersonii.AAC.1
MSASLVGSEMCIRDRDIVPVAPPWQTSSFAPKACPAWRTLTVPQARYTHDPTEIGRRPSAS